MFEFIYGREGLVHIALNSSLNYQKSCNNIIVKKDKQFLRIKV